MDFYLSSYRVGGRADELRRLAEGRTLAVITNAIDHVDPEVAEGLNATVLEELDRVGVAAELLDLKDYFERNDIADALEAHGGVWIRGGNTFVLRQAMRLSGCDRALAQLRGRDFLYGGYSAGVCVLAPSLDGLQHVDDSSVMPYPESSVIWEGLGFLDYLVLPHFRSDHPESADIDQEVEYCIEKRIPFRTLRDGDVIVIEG